VDQHPVHQKHQVVVERGRGLEAGIEEGDAPTAPVGRQRTYTEPPWSSTKDRSSGDTVTNTESV